MTITAATNGLDIDSQTLTTIGYTPSKLVVFCAPSNLPADNSTYQVVQVQLQDDSGRPARNPDSGTILKLFSSDLTVGNVCSPITIPLGQTQATGNFTLTNTPGATAITAIGSNYTTGQATLTTYGFTPTKIAVYCTPSILPADNSTYQIIQIQLQDDQGNPARNPDSNTTVRLFSSNTAVGNVTSEITIPLGQTQATGNFTLTNTPGATTITAIASNYTTGQADITSYFIDYRPMQATVTVNPDHVNGANAVQVSAYITGDGNPITGAQVSFTSDNGGTFSTVQMGNGYYNATFTTPNLLQTAICTITAHASKTEWLDCTGSAQITVAPAVTPTPTPTATPASTATPTPTSSPTATSSPTPAPSAGPNSTDTTTPQSTSATNGVAPIQLWIKDSNGYPLSGISVTSTAQPAGAQALSAVTNATGFVTFQNVTAGSYTFQVFKEGYQLVNQTFNATDQKLTHTIFLSNADSANNSQDTTTSPLLIPAIVAVIIIVAIVASILFVRRRWDIKLSPSS